MEELIETIEAAEKPRMRISIESVRLKECEV